MARTDPNSTRVQGVPRSERVVVLDRPHWLFVLTGAWKWILVGIAIWGVLSVVGGQTGYPIVARIGWAALGIVVLRLLIGFWDWAARVHVLTEARVIAKFGILRTVKTDLPLRRVQHLVLVRPFAERLFGLGSIGVASAGTGSIEVVWRGVDHPERVLEQIRKLVAAVTHGSASPTADSETDVVPVIGLVGGIGSGKSTVARAFADLGCLVSDSDESVREVLTRPEVIDRLVSWWGERILDNVGRINRSAIADIVFEAPDERFRLEELVHPLIRDTRQLLIEQARRRGAAGVIIDAPLLYEAGVDAECDTVVFVDTPRSIRQQRVMETRGWDAGELDRREHAQLSVEEKEEKSDWSVSNAGSTGDLAPRVADLLEKIRADIRGRSILDI